MPHISLSTHASVRSSLCPCKLRPWQRQISQSRIAQPCPAFRLITRQHLDRETGSRTETLQIGSVGERGLVEEVFKLFHGQEVATICCKLPGERKTLSTMSIGVGVVVGPTHPESGPWTWLSSWFQCDRRRRRRRRRCMQMPCTAAADWNAA